MAYHPVLAVSKMWKKFHPAKRSEAIATGQCLQDGPDFGKFQGASYVGKSCIWGVLPF
jgi:hypothetical protein